MFFSPSVIFVLYRAPPLKVIPIRYHIAAPPPYYGTRLAFSSQEGFEFFFPRRLAPNGAIPGTVLRELQTGAVIERAAYRVNLLSC